MPPLEGGADIGPDDEHGSREKDRLSDSIACAQSKREADRHPGGGRVRFKFARRAHQREIHSEVRNKPRREGLSRRKRRRGGKVVRQRQMVAAWKSARTGTETSFLGVMGGMGGTRKG